MPGYDIDTRERSRIARQCELDAERSAEQRNKLGQFATPPHLARMIACRALEFVAKPEFTMLEPSVGSGSFVAAVLAAAKETGRSVQGIRGVELDPRFYQAATEIWDLPNIQLTKGDFLESTFAEQRFDLLIANPPYVRHHHLNSPAKARYKEIAIKSSGFAPSGLSGLYVYFMLAAHAHLAPGSISAWLIPTEFLDTNYGKVLREYLSRRVTLLQIHRFDPEGLVFDDALVTSSVVYFQNSYPTGKESVIFTEGESILTPETTQSVSLKNLCSLSRWSTCFSHTAQKQAQKSPQLGQYFNVRRGIATGGNKFFILSRSDAESRGIDTDRLTPVLPGPKAIKSNIIEGDAQGWPLLEDQLVLLSSPDSIETIEKENPGLARYLAGVDQKTRNSYIATHRTPWYKVESRQTPPFVVTYMGRCAGQANPFRILQNRSKAIATNAYLLMYPKGELASALDAGIISIDDVHHALQQIDGQSLTSEGRVYGGGLRKIEPKELLKVDATAIAEILNKVPLQYANTLF